MIDKILKGFFWNHHQFRHMTFDELSELYTSNMLRSLAMNMAGIFIPVYLYQHGYEIWQIMLFYVVTFGFQCIVSIPAAYLVAKIGPKHSILISYVLQVFTLLGLIMIEHIPSYLLIGIVFGLSNITFFTAFHVNFSKVKHRKNGGNELGWLYIMERSGAVLGPLAGGIVAYIFAPEYTFWVAIAVLLVAAVPLFLTKEPVRTNQQINFKKLKLREVKSDLLSYSFFVNETAVSVIVWPLFIGVIVFQNNPYVQIGSIASISIVISVVVARTFGKIVDNKKGRNLLRFNATANAILHLFRAFTSGYSMALGINLINEGVTTGYRMPYFKGMYDAADDHPGSRIVYIATMEFFATLSRTIFFLFATLTAYNFSTGRLYFGVLFFLGAVSSIMIMAERFPALNPRRFKLL